MRIIRLAILLALAASNSTVLGAPTTAPSEASPTSHRLDAPIYVEVFLRAAPARSAKLAGEITAFDDISLTLRISGDDKTLAWKDLTGSSAFVVRSRLIDKSSATDWLQLGRFGWDMGVKDQAKSALASATHLDPSLKSEVAQILASELGSAVKAVANATAPPANSSTSKPADDGDVTTAASHQPTEATALPPSQSGHRLSGEKLQKYQKSSPADDAAAIAKAEKIEGDVSQKMGLKFSEFKTAHFICFNDWGTGSESYLKENLEGAYSVVSQAFDIPASENVFVGKLPIYMFERQSDFMKFANVADGFAASKSIAGYYGTSLTAGAHMAMWKPVTQTNNPVENHKAETTWAYVLTHEFTHAFIARYKSNEPIPRWLNEGLAEVIANSKFPRASAMPFARMMATRGADRDYTALFDDSQMPGGEMYPVMMTMVDTLVSRDKAAFLRYFDELKTGVDPNDALKKEYNLDDNGLIAAWKTYVTRH